VDSLQLASSEGSIRLELELHTYFRI